jgi:glycosyltransferase involved in cell wall biosynthesis
MPLADQRGGAESALLQLVHHGRGLGFDWRIVFLEDGPMVAECRAAGAPATVVRAGRLREIHRYAGSVTRLGREFRREPPDVVVGWMTKAQLYAGPAARLAGAPAVWCQHGMASSRSGLDRAATALPARGVVAVSQAAGRNQRVLRPHRPVKVVYPGVDLERFDQGRLPPPADARARLALPAEGGLVGIVARLQRWKGVHVLIEALPHVMRRHPDLHCVVVGGAHELEPDYEPYLRRTVADLGLEERVIFAGRQPEVALWLQAMDVVVHASADEPFGLTIVEAMALGKPVVAAASGGPLEIVGDSIDGLLVPHGDAQALASAVIRLLGDTELAGRLGKAAQQRASEFSSRRYAVRFAEAVRDLAR